MGSVAATGLGRTLVTVITVGMAESRDNREVLPFHARSLRVQP
jgi:hypothetical protein